MLVTSRTELQNYILRKLGQGVVDVEITPDQMSDIIDDTLQRFSEEVEDGVQESILVVPLTKGTTQVLLDDTVMGISSVFYGKGNQKSSSAIDPFNYSMYQSDIWKFLYNTDGTASNIYITKSYFETLKTMFDVDISFDFNHQTKLLNLLQTINYDTLLAMSVFKDTRDNDKIWNHQFIKKYSTGLAWRQWSNNIAKYNGSILVGGMEINADTMKNNADTLLQEVEEEIQDKWTTPLGIFLG